MSEQAHADPTREAGPIQVTADGLLRPIGTASTGASGPIRKELGRPLIRQLEALCEGRGTIGALEVLIDLIAIAATIAVGVLTYRYVLPPVLCVLYLGVRQRHLSNLGHECVHGKITKSPTANVWLGRLITCLLGESFAPYRASHKVHHAKLGSASDPMFQSYLARGATTPVRDKRALVSRVIVANALWLLPWTTVRALFSRAEGETWTAVTSRAATWAGIVAAAAATETLPYLLIFWVLPLVLIRPVVTWITDLGNHAGVIQSGDPITQTRGWTSHPLTRHVLGGHLDDMFHPIHHWCPRIPWRKLPDAAAILRQDYPRWDEVPWCSGFFFRRRSTPHIPCVLDDIVTRLQHGDAS